MVIKIIFTVHRFGDSHAKNFNTGSSWRNNLRPGVWTSIIDQVNLILTLLMWSPAVGGLTQTIEQPSAKLHVVSSDEFVQMTIT